MSNQLEYTDYDFDLITLYNEYIENIVNGSNIPKKVKKYMLEEREILKDNTSYYLQYKQYKVNFLTYRDWIKERELEKIQKKREEKLKQLGL